MESKKKTVFANRVIPAVIMAIFAAAIICLNPFCLGIVFVVMGIMAQLEMKTVYEKVSAKPYFVIYLFPPALFALWVIYGPFDLSLPIFALCLIAALLGFISRKIIRLQATLLAAVYPGIPMLALAALCTFGAYGAAASKSLVQSCIIIVVGGVAAGDIAAMAVGAKIGKRKLCPAISPGKTVEGLIAQLVATPLFVFGAWLAISAWIYPEFPIGDALIIGFLCGPLAVAGDLLASWLKRKAGIKDFGKILGGHGGILDRFDGMSVAALFAILWFVSWKPFYFS